MDTINWLIDWFEQNTSLSRDDISKHLIENYLLKGWIDSLQFINFITDIENHFKIYFSNEEFQNREFSTIEGLSKIIESKTN